MLQKPTTFGEPAPSGSFPTCRISSQCFRDAFRHVGFRFSGVKALSDVSDFISKG
jgi:hypothetical protein